MSSVSPTSVSFSLNRLARHGGAEGPHRDGWGVAFYEGPDALVLREPVPASDSYLVSHIERHGPPSKMVISHIRYASLGQRALRNTQPFVRELGGRRHVFVHNGDLPDIAASLGPPTGPFRPIGETDSELAFCHLINGMSQVWSASGAEPPPLHVRLRHFADCARALADVGSANLIYSDSDVLFAHAHHRTEPGSDDVLPGLYMLTRSCSENGPDLSESGVQLEPVRQALTLLASVPLTEEEWTPLAEGEVLAVRSGVVVQRHDIGSALGGAADEGYTAMS